MPSFWDRIRNRLVPPPTAGAPPGSAQASRPPPPRTEPEAGADPPPGGYPNTYGPAEGESPGFAHARVFEPALKQYPRAFRLADPVIASPEAAETWRRGRRQVMGRLLRAATDSLWKEHLVLRGSLLLKAWLGEAAREPGDIDWVVTPSSIGAASQWSQEMLEGLVESVSRDPVAGEAAITGFSFDDIWTYERAQGKRIAFAWRTGNLPLGAVQMDFVFGEALWTEPVLTSIPVPGGALPVLAATRELALAWKLLWLETDSYPQGKDLYDATLLAEQTRLPLSLLEQVLRAGDYPPARQIQPGFPLEWDVDWENFQRECPWVGGEAADWQARLAAALAPSFAADSPPPS